MSRNSDINQLLDEIGTSDRSAGDPWTISRSSQGTVKRDSFSPAVVADLGAPAHDLTSEMQSSEQIAKADEVVTSPTGSSGSASGASSIGSGILGGFLNLFPLASVVGKLFGLGGSSSPPPLTPYIQPPSVNFDGSMSGALSNSTASSLSGSGPSASGAKSNSSSGFAPGISSLSYGANGLARTTEDMAHDVSPSTEALQDGTAPSQRESPSNSSQNVSGQLDNLTRSSFASEPSGTSPAPSNASVQPDSSSDSSPDVMGQLTSLTSSNFNAQPAPGSPVSSADVMSTSNAQAPGSSSLSSSPTGNATSPSDSGSSASSSQQGQSILVQVQAMDSQSFMDHSNDIAQAVRQAMLNSHSVNDVIADL